MVNYLQIGVQESKNGECPTVEMTVVLYLCLLLLPWANAQLDYLPPPFRRALHTSTQLKHTDFYTYHAPNDLGAHAAPTTGELLRASQQVVFIRAPETNIFTLTADQLAKRNALDIYVLSRQTNADSLAQQLQEIQQRSEQKPAVHFVKYRTPQDVTRALATLKGVYQHQLPGSSVSHRESSAQVLNFGGGRVREQALPPVIFKILPRGGAEYEVHSEPEALLSHYLPAAELRTD